MALGTKDVTVGGDNGPSKLIEPGNLMGTITKVELDQPNFLAKDKGYYLVLHMEGPDLGEDFVGFFIDKDNESLGRHKGQVGRVKYDKWPFKDGETKSGIPVNRDANLLKAIKNLCSRMDIVTWFEKQDEKYDTIEEFINALNSEKPYAGKALNYCIASRQYMKQNGYPGNDLYLPKYNANALPFEEITASPSKIAKFDELTHLEVPQPVPSFGDDDEIGSKLPPDAGKGSDFDI